SAIHQDVDILTGQILDGILRRRLEPDAHHVVREAVQFVNATGNAPNRYALDGMHDLANDRHRGKRLCLTEQRETLTLLLFRNAAKPRPAMIDETFRDLRLARATDAVPAVICQRVTAGERRRKYRLLPPHSESAIER